MTAPDLVIGGAPKCGTSSLFRWLSDHPAVCGSEPKEPFYLMDPEHPLRNATRNYHDGGWAGYETFFEHCGAHSGALQLEGTTHYLYQQTAREALASLDSPPQVVFVVRKPSARVRSSFLYTRDTLGRLKEDTGFDQFVEAALHDEKHLGKLLGSSESAYVLARDVRYSQYVDYLKTWKRCLGAENVEVLLFEEVVGAPRASMKQLARSVGVAPAFYEHYDFPSANETYATRSRRLHQWAWSVASWLPSGPFKKLLKRGYFFFQKKEKKAEVSDAEALAALERHFRPYNRRLGDAFDLDLSAWNE